MFAAPTGCRSCEGEVLHLLTAWRADAMRVLQHSGPSGPEWERHLARLRYERVGESAAREAIGLVAVEHLQRLVAFAFADGVIEQHEADQFEAAAAAFGVYDGSIERMRGRLERGLQLSRIRNGDLPRVTSPDLHLELEETVHLDVPVTRVRRLASGDKLEPGRLVASSRKLRFIGSSAGTELAWAKVHSITTHGAYVEVAASTARGGGSYRVPDPELVAAVLEGTLRVAKRLVLAPDRRDTRAVPPDVKAAVWQRDGGRCTGCGAQEYLEFDHIIPFSRGGATSTGNLQILCRRCNQEKGARM
jgi:hypothetical protein